MDQPFAELEYESNKRKTRQGDIPCRMDGLIPGNGSKSASARSIPRRARGRRPYELSAMLLHCVQLFYNPSDPGMEDMLYEISR